MQLVDTVEAKQNQTSKEMSLVSDQFSFIALSDGPF